MSRSQKQERYELDVERERINLWPLLYRRPGFTSVLWPLADFDKNGMAIRPFYVQDKNEYSILFPLSGWNPVNGDGWVFTGYWNKNANGIFPLYHVGNDLGYVLPVWWTKKYFGGPLVCFARKKGVNFVGPVWYNSKSGKSGFFPFVLHEGFSRGYCFPLYFYDCKADEKLILPLFGALGHYYRSKDDQSLMVLTYCHSNYDKGRVVNDMFLPLYLYRRVEDKSYIVSIPFIYTSSAGGKEYFIDILGPLFFKDKSKDESYTGVMWPLGGRSACKDSTTTWAVPLFLSRESDGWKRVFTLPFSYGSSDKGYFMNVLGPVFHYDKDEERAYTGVMWPFGGFIDRKDGDKTAWGVPLFYYSNKNGYSRFLSLPFSIGNGKDKGFVNVLGPVFHHSKNRKDSLTFVMWPFAGYESSRGGAMSWVFPFYCKDDDGNKSSLWVMPYYSEDNKAEKKEVRAFLPFYHTRKTPKEESLWIFPWGQSETKSGEYSAGVFPFGFYESDSKNKKLICPLFLSSFSNRETNLLWPLLKYSYDKDKSFRFWPLVSVYDDLPSPVVNVSDKSVSVLTPLCFYYGTEKTKKSESRRLSVLSLTGSVRKLDDKSCLESGIGMYGKNGVTLEHDYDYYLLYYRSRKKEKVWNTDKINTRDIGKVVNLWRKLSNSKTLMDRYESSGKDFEKRYHDVPIDKKWYKDCLKDYNDKAVKYRMQYSDERSRLSVLLKKHGFSVKGDDEQALKASLAEFEKKFSKIENHGFNLFLPFFFSSFDDEQSKWNFLLFLAEGKESKDYSSFRILKYLYRQQYQKDKYNYDIFPFINYRGSKKFSKFSFCWRLFSMRKDKTSGKTSGHILFIPF
jgi:hypothetical protein